MRRGIFVTVLMFGTLFSLDAVSEEATGTDDLSEDNASFYKKGGMVVGGFLGFGITSLLGNGHVYYSEQDFWDMEMRDDDRTAMFSGGGGAYFDYYFAPYWAVEAGLGFTTKGIRYKGTGEDGEWKAKLRFMYFEIPIMAKLNYENFMATFGLSLSIALSGVQSLKDDRGDVAQRWSSSNWDSYNRVNIGPRLGVAYAIPVGPVNIVPSITWSLHLVDELNDGDIEARDDDPRSHRFRAMNLMFNAGAEWGLPL